MYVSGQRAQHSGDEAEARDVDEGAFKELSLGEEHEEKVVSIVVTTVLFFLVIEVKLLSVASLSGLWIMA